jgi:DNA-binding CsgD family transcriptional regulator
VIVGRERELGELHATVAAAQLGTSGAVIIRGDAGLGKTALLDELVRGSGSCLVIRTVGIEPEIEMPFAGLHALLRPLLGLLDDIPAPQAAAIRAAFALDDAEPDRLAVSAGTVSLLAAMADRRPVLVVVDDAHWIDRPSIDALLFTARRIAAERLVVVFAVRSDVDTALEGTGLREITLEPLTESDALTVLDSRWRSLDPGVARRVMAAAVGNPLALVEISAALSDEQRVGTEPLGDLLPVTGTVERGVRRRLSTLAARTRQELLTLAAGAPGSLVDAEALEPAETAGIVSLGAGAAVFVHPMYQSAVYQLADPAERRAAHRRIAQALPADDEYRRAWHLAAAATSPDDELAAMLERAAGAVRQRGGVAASARTLAKAADLSIDDSSRCRRLHAAATAAYLAGDAAQAVRLAELALDKAPDPTMRATAMHRLAVIGDWYGRWGDRTVSDETLVAEASRIEQTDPRLAVGLLGVVLQRRFQALDTAAALDLAERRLARCPPDDSERHGRALQDLARATGLRGDAERCSRICDEVLANREPGGSVGFATNIAEPLVWLERFTDARAVMTAAVGEARAEGNIVRLMFELTNLGVLEHRTGDVARAIAAASQAVDLATEAGNDYLRACNLALLARIGAMRGDPQAGAQADEATAIAERLSDRLIAAEVTMGRAEEALATGRPADAVLLLEPLRQFALANEIREPSVLPFHPDLAEAYVLTGRREEASALVDELETVASTLRRGWALAAVARCRGLAADDDRFAGEFETSLALHDAASASSFQRARTLLLFAGRLRRAKKRQEARVHLREAIAAFDALGATPWSDLARAELAATGEKLQRRGGGPDARLTPQELQITLQVAEGRTNREIAEALFLSPKTVEFHLTSVYRKLDLTSRRELIRAVATGGLDPRAGVRSAT